MKTFDDYFSNLLVTKDGNDHTAGRQKEESDAKKKKGGSVMKKYNKETASIESNLTKCERAGLKSLKKRVKAGELVVAQSDKSSRLCVMSRAQYIESGNTHTEKDEKIDWPQVKTLQNQVNSTVWWLAKILNISVEKDNSRMMKNLQNHSTEVAEMYLLFKDHKSWTEGSNKAIPSRPVVSGNNTYNVHLSELLSEILEPVAKEMQGAEIASTEDALNKIQCVNSWITDGQMIDELDGLELDKKQHDFRSKEKVSPRNSFTQESDTSFNFSDKSERSLLGLLDELHQENGQEGGGSTTDTKRGSHNPPQTPPTGKGGGAKHEGVEKNKFSQQSILSFINSNATSGTSTMNNNKVNPNIKKKKKSFNEQVEQNFNESLEWGLSHDGKIRTLLGEEESFCPSRNDQPPIQDLAAPPIMIGGDVVALYPSMEASPTATIAYHAVKNSKIKFNSLNMAYAVVFLLLTLGSTTMAALGLEEVIPKRKRLEEFHSSAENDSTKFKFKTPSKSGNPRSLNANLNRNLMGWDFSEVKLDEFNKREILARVIQIMVLVLMVTHSYSFDGKLFRQRSGAPIGLRASACLAKILMVDWDMKWSNVQKRFKLKIHLLYRYVDDIRLYLRPINLGWKWSTFGWVWAPTDNDTDVVVHTKEQLKKSFEAIFNFLKFTTEEGSEYADGMLPTLDFKTQTLGNGMIRFEFFNKEMENNRVLDKSTALSKGTIFSALRQNLVRRLLNTCEEVSMNKRLLIVEKFIQLMVNSGHKFQFIRSIVQQAITKYLYMVRRSKLDSNDDKFQPLYRPPEYRSAERIMQKHVEAHIWFKRLDLGDEHRQSWKYRIKSKTTRNNRTENSVGNIISKLNEKNEHYYNKKNKLNFRFERETTTAIFVPPSFGGVLTDMIMTSEEELSDTTGWNMKVVEASGMTLAQMLKPKFEMEEGCVLETLCAICNNTGIGCGKKNVVYSAECTVCSPSSGQEGGLIDSITNSEEISLQANQHLWASTGSNGQHHGTISSAKEQYQDVISNNNEQYQDETPSTNEQYQDVISSTNERHQGLISDKNVRDSELYSGTDNPISERSKAIYIGETSRPVRSRILEHLRKAKLLSTDSFIVSHWCTSHGTETVQPEFKFKIESSCTDSLSRQIEEAVIIEETGTLNSKSEFGMNHLCRMVVEHNPWDTEEMNKQDEQSRRKNKQDLVEFVAMMKNVRSRCKTNPDEDLLINTKEFSSRYNKKKKRKSPPQLKSTTRLEESLRH